MNIVLSCALIYLAAGSAAQFVGRPGIWRPGGFRSKDNNETIKYVITFPSTIQKSKDFSFDLILFEDKSYQLPVKFTANLTANGVQMAVQSFTQSQYGLQRHIFSNLKNAKVTDDAYPSVTITFNTDGFKNYTDVSGREQILSEAFVFIQTDKAMYKPTQTVNMRAVAIDRQLSPINTVVNVTLQDSKSNQLKTWTNQQLSNGVFSGNYKLSDFVSLGDWSIVVSGKDIPTTTKTFTVQQYVLPKYEVTLDFKQANNNGYWLFNADDESAYQGFIKAKYTFGKSVKGSAVIRLQSTGSCSFAYDYPDSYYYGNTDKKPTISKVVMTVPLAGDGSSNDGKFTFNGVNKAISYNPFPPLMFIDGSEEADATTTTTKRPQITKPKMTSQECQLSFQVNVTEELTGEKISSEGTVMLYRDPYAIGVHDSVQKTLKPGLSFTMRFQVATPDNVPVAAGTEVALEAYFFTENTTQLYGRVACGAQPMRPSKQPGSRVDVTPTPDSSMTVKTDADGLVSIKVVVPKNTSSALFKARLVNFPAVEECESRSPPQSESKQAVSISIDRPATAAKTIPKTGERLTFKIDASFQVPMVYFMVVQNGNAFVYKQLTNPTSTSALSTTFTTTVDLPRDAAPRCSAVVWTVENTTGEILADAIEFKVDGLLRQNVTASFSPGTVRPRSNTTLTVSTTEPNSFVALLAVDKSVRLLKSGYDITLDDVMGSVGEGQQSGYGFRPVQPLLWRCWRCGWWPWWVDSSNAESVFSGVGMIIKSNVETSASYPYVMARLGGIGMERSLILPMASPNAAEATASRSSNGGKSEEPRVRMLFPETWLWNETSTNGQGKLIWPLTAPDTITTWELTAFSVGKTQGFGVMEKPAELTVFQDFFVNLDISQPTIIRGEQVQLKAVVFNYQAKEAQVDLVLKKSDDFEVSLDNGVSFAKADFRKTVKVPANNAISLPVWVRPTRLGTIKMNLVGYGSASSDAMIKEVLVEPEGEVRYANKPVLVRLDSNGVLSYSIDAVKMLGDVSEDSVVEGSKMFQLQAIGDILGPALSQLGSQIRLPTGCGEQTMVILAPNVYIYKYLKSVNLLTDELSTKTTGFVEQGYQRELTYQRDDGGFSAFGNTDSESSTWLTAFVMRSFAAAKKYVGTRMDEAPLKKAWDFLNKQAQSNGTFGEPGRVLHLSMKGGATSDVNLAAYIYATAAEAGVDMRPFDKTRQLIVKTGRDAATKDAYQLAVIAYALSIRDADRDTGKEVMNRLLGLANKEGGLTYWKPENDQSAKDEYQQSGPTQIETSSYALLAYLNIFGMSDDAVPIGRWLMSQRNSLGGFASTQDTVVGLQAISELAAKLRANGLTFTVDAVLTFDDDDVPLKKSFEISDANAQLLQSFDTPRERQALKSVDLMVKGVGVGLVQLALRYNVQKSPALNSGDYTIIVSRDAMAKRKRRSADSDGNELPDLDNEVIIKACVKPTQASPGMVLVEVGVPTGFEADLQGTQTAMRKADGSFKGTLKRIELGERKIVYYFDSLENPRYQTCVFAKLTRTMAVKNTQPPTARVYSYYEPSRFTATEYTFMGMEANDLLPCQNVMLGVKNCPN